MLIGLGHFFSERVYFSGGQRVAGVRTSVHLFGVGLAPAFPKKAHLMLHPPPLIPLRQHPDLILTQIIFYFDDVENERGRQGKAANKCVTL